MHIENAGKLNDMKTEVALLQQSLQQINGKLESLIERLDRTVELPQKLALLEVRVGLLEVYRRDESASKSELAKSAKNQQWTIFGALVVFLLQQVWSHLHFA
jgi:hypothetical protein